MAREEGTSAAVKVVALGAIVGALAGAAPQSPRPPQPPRKVEQVEKASEANSGASCGESWKVSDAYKLIHRFFNVALDYEEEDYTFSSEVDASSGGVKIKRHYSATRSRRKGESEADTESPAPTRGPGDDEHFNDELRDKPIRFLLATVPDPSDPPLALTFDRQLSAILAAAQNAGYVLDSQSIPWPHAAADGSDGKGETEKVDGRPLALLDPSAQKMGSILFRREARCAPEASVHAVQPVWSDGELWLRQGPKQSCDSAPMQELLAVLLVRETPTYGIEKCAFDQAMAMMAARLRQTHKPSDNTFYLLAPSYSGSALSLETLLRGWRRRITDSRFTILSGSATAFDIYERLNRIPGASFHATVLPDELMQEAIVHFLLTVLEVDPKDVVLLVEQDSTYGQAIISSSKSLAKQRKANIDSGLMVMPFPMNISSLRESVERVQHDSDSDHAHDPLNLTRGSLELSLESGRPTHLPPDFAAASVFSTEKMLDKIIGEINRAKYKFVGIAASEPVDRIFLARRIRQSNPDLTIFFVENEILYQHPDLTEELYGSLVVTTYPLFTRNQLWSAPYDGQHLALQFPSGEAQGIYNATIFLLDMMAGEISDEHDHPLEYGNLLEGACSAGWSQWFSDFGWRNSESPLNLDCGVGGREEVVRPPIWISAVGAGNLWPLLSFAPYYRKRFVENICHSGNRASPDDSDDPSARCYTLPDKARQYVAGGLPSERPPKLELIPPPYGELLLLLLFCGVATVVALAGHFANLQPSTRLPPLYGLLYGSTIFRAFAPARGEARAALLFRLLWLAIMALTVAYLTRWFVGYPFVIAARFPGALLFYVVAALFVGHTIFRLALAMGGVLDVRLRPRRAFLARVGCLAGTLAVLLAPYRGAYPTYDVGNRWDDVVRFSSQVIYAYRVTDVFDRLSPAAPLTLFAILFTYWCYGHLRRIIRARVVERQELVPIARGRRDRDGKLKHVFRMIERTLDAGTAPSWKLPGFAPLMTLLCWLGFMLWVRLGTTLDGRAFRWGFGLAFIGGCGAIVLQLLRLANSWQRARQLLRALATSPLVGAFSRLPRRFWRDLPTRAIVFKPRIETEPSKELIAEYDELIDRAGRRLQPTESSTPNGAKVQRLVDSLEAYWRNRPLAGKPPADVSWKDKLPRETALLYTEYPTTEAELLMRLAEEGLAARFGRLIGLIVDQVRGAIDFCTMAVLVLLLVLQSYPFEPHRFMLVITFVIAVAVIASAVWVFVQLNRDEIISRLTGTKPGEVTWNFDFISQLVVFVLLPVLSFVAAQFPSIAAPLSRLLGQIFHGVK